MLLGDSHAGLAYRPLRWLEQWGFLGVQLFFVVSGACIAAAARGTRGPAAAATFLRRRARRIFPTFWAATALAAAIGLVVAGLAAAGLSARLFDPFAAGWHWLSSLLLVETSLKTFGIDPDYGANGPLWSLCYEVPFYAWVAFAWVARGRRTRVVATVATTAAAVLVRAVPSLRPRGFLLDLWPDFLCGLWVHARLTSAPTRRDRLLLDVGLVAAVAAYVLAFRVGGDGFPQDAKTSLVCLAFAALLVALFPHDDRLASSPLGRGLAWVGERSYSLYLTHFPVVMLVAGLVVPRALAHGPLLYASAAATVAACFLVALPFHTLVERRFLAAPRAISGTSPARPHPEPSR
ncbi:MAG: acyltransferase [Planctomycetia bacterium]|nr:acyltransferase [Planctomycetia bacterium]